MPSTSKSQQRLFGMVHAYQKGKLKHAPAKVREIAEHISEEDAEHFAKTRHEGLPERRGNERGEEKSAAYIAGFLFKCAEYGVDGRSLMKYALVRRANPNEKRPLPVQSDRATEFTAGDYYGVLDDLPIYGSRREAERHFPDFARDVSEVTYGAVDPSYSVHYKPVLNHYLADQKRRYTERLEAETRSSLPWLARRRYDALRSGSGGRSVANEVPPGSNQGSWFGGIGAKVKDAWNGIVDSVSGAYRGAAGKTREAVDSAREIAHALDVNPEGARIQSERRRGLSEEFRRNGGDGSLGIRYVTPDEFKNLSEVEKEDVRESLRMLRDGV